MLIFVSDKKGKKIVLLFTLTPLLMIDKKGEKYFSIYACFSCFIRKEGVRIFVYAYCFVLQKGKKNLMSFMLDWHVYLLIFAYMFV